jgi:hypothetical protein
MWIESFLYEITNQATNTVQGSCEVRVGCRPSYYLCIKPANRKLANNTLEIEWSTIRPYFPSRFGLSVQILWKLSGDYDASKSTSTDISYPESTRAIGDWTPAGC